MTNPTSMTHWWPITSSFDMAEAERSWHPEHEGEANKVRE